MVFLFLTGVLMISYFFAKSFSVSKTIIMSFICFSCITFFSGEFLSLLRAYNKSTINLVWGGGFFYFLFLVLKEKRQLRLSLSTLRKLYSQWNSFEKLMIFTIIIMLGFTFFRAVGYAPQNVDSLVYHLPRAFYYYKNEAIGNVPAAYAWTNYTAPANAVFMAQLLILNDGNDFLLNLIQLPAILVCAASCNLICNSLEVKRELCMLSSGMVICLPLAVLQAATTQCDLLAAGYCAATVAAMMLILQEKNVHIMEFAILGLAGGCALYTKITSGITLLFPTVFFVVVIIKKFKTKSFLPIATAGFIGALVNFLYWIRNFIDLNGDFLAFNVSTSLSGNLFEIGIRNYLGRIILNIGYATGGRDLSYGFWLTRICKELYNLIGATECKNIEKYSAVSAWEDHNGQPYGMYVWLILLSLLACVLLRKTINLGIRLYVGISAIAFFFSSMFLSVSQTATISSAPRYLLPAIVICIPGICSIFNELVYKHDGKLSYAVHSIVKMLTVLILVNGFHANLFDASQPLLGWDRKILFHREESRDYAYGDKGWGNTKNVYMKQIKEQNITEIGIWENTLSGIYPMLNVLKDKRYNVKSIYGEYADQHIDPIFEPQAILYIGEKDILPEELEYRGQLYMRVGDGSALPWNNAASGLYLK